MPELPEVETVRRGLSRRLDFNSVAIVRVEQSNKKLRYSPDPKFVVSVSFLSSVRLSTFSSFLKIMCFFLIWE